MFQAFARVITPEYKYWKPIPGTAREAECEVTRAVKAYARVTEPFASQEWRRNRLLSEMMIMQIHPDDATA